MLRVSVAAALLASAATALPASADGCVLAEDARGDALVSDPTFDIRQLTAAVGAQEITFTLHMGRVPPAPPRGSTTGGVVWNVDYQTPREDVQIRISRTSSGDFAYADPWDGERAEKGWPVPFALDERAATVTVVLRHDRGRLRAGQVLTELGASVQAPVEFDRPGANGDWSRSLLMGYPLDQAPSTRRIEVGSGCA